MAAPCYPTTLEAQIVYGGPARLRSVSECMQDIRAPIITTGPLLVMVQFMWLSN